MAIVDRSRSLPTLLTAFVLCAFSAFTVSAQNWVSTDWVVRCLPATADSLGSQSAAECSDDRQTGAASIVRAHLEEASPWLQDLGFKPPDIGTVQEESRKYEAWISDTKVHGDEYGYFDSETEQMYVNSSHYFVMGEDEDVEQTGTPIHELFHAIQHSYQAGDIYDAPDRDWIFEGTAEHVMLAKMRRDGRHVESPTRFWDYSLHEPDVSEDGTCYDCYATAEFWSWLGNRLASRDDVQYLHGLLQKDLETANGLEALDLYLKERNAGGLYQKFPQFVADQVLRREQFSRDGIQDLRASYSDARQTVEVEGSVRPAAAMAYSVNVVVPEGKAAKVTIEFAEDNPHLHLVVDDHRYDQIAPGGPVERNVFETNIHGQEKTLFVRVTNVARDAVDSRERDYTLLVTVEPIDMACTFTATVQGDMSGIFDGASTVAFDTESGTDATISDIYLESEEGFDLSVGVQPALRAGDSGLFEGVLAVAGRGPDTPSGEVYGFWEEYGDFVAIDIDSSRAIPLEDLPESLWGPLTGGRSLTTEQSKDVESQTGDVAVHGTLRGQLTQTLGRLADALPGYEPKQISFEASFDARSETFGCDYEGFWDRIERDMREVNEMMNERNSTSD